MRLAWALVPASVSGWASGSVPVSCAPPPPVVAPALAVKSAFMSTAQPPESVLKPGVTVLGDDVFQ